MSDIFERPLPVGKTVDYTLTEKADWLNGATIVNPTVTASEGGVTVGAVVTDGQVVQARLTGTDTGRYKIHFDYALSDGRTYCYVGVIDVINC